MTKCDYVMLLRLMKKLIMPFFNEQKFKDIAEEKQSGECTVKGYTD